MAGACLGHAETYYAHQYTRPLDPKSVTNGPGEGFFLDLEDTSTARQGDSSGSAPVYYDYFARKYIVYYFFFPYNDYEGAGTVAHEGDWEYIIVNLDASNRMTHVAYHTHHCANDVYDAAWLLSGDGVTQGLYQSTHPIVYISTGAHGTHPQAGNWPNPISCGLEDNTSQGPVWHAYKKAVGVETQPWYGFGGAWGEVGEAELTTGPPGPSKYKKVKIPAGWATD